MKPNATRKSRMSFVPALLLVVAVGLFALAGTEKAEAAVYRADANGLRVVMVSQGGQIVEFTTTYRLRCSDGSTRRASHFRYSNLSKRMPVEPSNGRFFMRIRERNSSPNYIVDIGGRLMNDRVQGFLFEEVIPELTSRPRCATVGRGGSSRIRFTANRLPPKSAKALLDRTRVYSMRRTGLSVFGRLRPGGEFFPFQIRYDLTCSNGRTPTQVLSADGREFPFNPASGRFRFRSRSLADSLNAEFVLQGRVSSRRIVGAVSYSEFVSPGGGRPAYFCWTGRSRNDPVVRFVAPRIQPPMDLQRNPGGR